MGFNFKRSNGQYSVSITLEVKELQLKCRNASFMDKGNFLIFNNKFKTKLSTFAARISPTLK